MIEGATPSRNTNSTAGIKDTICPSTKSRWGLCRQCLTVWL
jgi:hypothetical protein